MDKTIFNDLFLVDVNEHKKEKNGLNYLSWSWAWAEVKKRYPDATYTIRCNENGLPYFKEDGVGYMCMTEVTIGDETLMMWLPVMDYKNKAILQPTMFDVNKTLMRCLTKNLGMFGLGLYIYAGEDLPDDLDKTSQKEDLPDEEDKTSQKKDFSLAEYVQAIQGMKVKIDKDDPDWWSGIVTMFNVNRWEDITKNNVMEIGKLCKEKVQQIGLDKEIQEKMEKEK